MFNDFWQTIINSPFLGIVLSIVAFYIGTVIQHKAKTPLANPLLIAAFICIAFLKLTGLSYETYNIGGSIIYMFLGPMTCLLAVGVYNRFEVLKKNLIPILIGTFVGSCVAVASILVLSNLFGLDEIVRNSLAPKSVTTAISLQLSDIGGGLASITFASTTITGFVGAMFSPLLKRVFCLTNPTAVGLAIGTSSHALGTTRAIQMGETEGAISSIAIALAGLSTVIIYSIFPVI